MYPPSPGPYEGGLADAGPPTVEGGFVLFTQLSTAPDVWDALAKEVFSVRCLPTNQNNAQARASTTTPATTIPAMAPLERDTPW